MTQVPPVGTWTNKLADKKCSVKVERRKEHVSTVANKLDSSTSCHGVLSATGTRGPPSPRDSRPQSATRDFHDKEPTLKKIDFKNNFILYERWVSGLDTEWDFLNKFSSQRSVYSCSLKSSKLDLRAQLKMKWQLETTQQISKTRARTKFEQVAATIISKNFEPANSSERRSFNWNYWKRGKLWRV